ncbi:AAA-domain-containing protein [Lojkania enalia]|uniref:AAA-domain-containing protein n=1 Tax=Lojkania enalia TaxID=147567 RepID=A0A9P4MUU4_9PLEO|nr:AAA-domain-containing protein [Didymosphaeria enalia]
MYAVIRPALRSSSPARSPARLVRGRRYPLACRFRSFHSTRSLAQGPNPPSGSDNTPLNDNGGNKERTDKTVQEEEQPNAGVATEDPEVLTQKLQRSREMARRYSSALKRSQRRNRTQDLPPIRIPDWFLNGRVRLREQSCSNTQSVPTRTDWKLSIKHIGTGEHGTCSIPFRGSYARGVRSVVDLVTAMWKDLSEEQKRDFARDLVRRIGVPENADHANPVGKKGKENSDFSPPSRGFDRFMAEAEMVEELNMKTTGSEVSAPSGVRRKLGALKGTVPGAFKMTETQSAPNLGREANLGRRISPLLISEIQATIAASLSSIQPAISDSFPSSKTNLILHAPSNDHERSLTRIVHSISSEIEADVVTLDAQDLAQLVGDYLGEGLEPSPHSIRSLGYETYKFGSELASEIDDLGREDAFEDEQDVTANQSPTSDTPTRPTPLPRFQIIMGPNLKTLSTLKDISQNLKSIQTPGAVQAENTYTPSNQGTRAQSAAEAQLEDLKLTNILEALVDSNQLKRAREAFDAKHVTHPAPSSPSSPSAKPGFFDFSMKSEEAEVDFSSVLPMDAKLRIALTVSVGTSLRHSKIPPKAKIVHIRDIKELNATYHGSRILQKLEDIVWKHRVAGENIMLLGTTSSLDLVPELSASGVQGLQSEGEASRFRTIVVPIASVNKYPTSEDDTLDITSAVKASVLEQSSSLSEKRKFRDINLRHIQDMLYNLDPIAASKFADTEECSGMAAAFMPIFPEPYSWKVLTYDEVHRICLAALGLHLLESNSPHLSWAHVALAMGLLKASDEVKFAYVRNKASEEERDLRNQFREQLDKFRESMGKSPLRRQRSTPQEAENTHRKRDLDRIAMNATKHEKNLMHGIANPDQLKTTFDHVHVPKDTIEAIRTLTTLSLLRPDAFNYGVLSTDKISGCLLYGPPGTGKTLLAKAVAKESGSTVLEVSGSEINDKYVGEGEKNVRAIFSLARKLSPCVVFLDEADAIFGARDSSRQRISHRDILNQFLKEWDGLNDLGVFVMVATNRPFDLDDAVIRRLPRRLLVDLPTQEDRKKILEIHLRGEQLDSSVDLGDLAKRTPLYSGSDLKNLAISAALACVREENENAAIAAAETAASTAQDSSSTGHGDPSTESTSLLSTPLPQLVRGQNYDFPEKRTLHIRHFEKALQEVSASISEDMTSLNAIKKFDEQYGDRRGRRKKKAYGFGISQEKNENAARVRF